MSDWYTPENSKELVREYARGLETLDVFLSRQLNLAFDKGRQIGAGELRAALDRAEQAEHEAMELASHIVELREPKGI